ncbi:MAG TPA: hypothetical protein VF039_14775 [Longimicrobiales bacterium]
MIRAARIVVGGLATVGVLAAIGWASRVPHDARGADAATLRLSWRMPGGSAQVCRDRTQAELDALPVHMRTPQVCETRLTTYLLETRVDDGPVLSRRLRPSGARGDRPLAVWQETRLSPGRHRIAIRLTREGGAYAGHGRDDDDGYEDDAEDDRGDHDDDDRDDDDALALDAVVEAHAGRIVLVTLDQARGLTVR